MSYPAKPNPLLRRCLILLAVVAASCGSSTASAPDRASDTSDAQARAAVAAWSCPPSATNAGASRPGPVQGNKLQVVTTVAPLTSIIANVAGTAAEVTGVIPEGEDSHTYEPKPSVAGLMSTADLVFVNGLKLEDPTRDIAAKNLSATGQILELGTLTLTEQQYLYDFSFPRDGGKPNPHLWTHPLMSKCYAAIAASAMSKADPANAAVYAANYAKYGAKLDQLDVLMQKATETIPATNRKLLTYHDAYAYFAVHYGWTVVGAIQVSNFEEPTPREVANLVKQVKAEKIPVVFGSEVFPSPVLDQIAKESGAKYVDELRDDDLPGAPGDTEHSFLGLMKFDFVTMVRSLGGDATALEAFDSTDVVTDTADYPQ
jgi:ABC-type Zn uptake system ZnuABC Zn-binding protein ZnuA